MEEKELEWLLKEYPSGIKTFHVPCKRITVEYIPGLFEKAVNLFICGKCKKKCPEHIIFQYKILTGY